MKKVIVVSESFSPTMIKALKARRINYAQFRGAAQDVVDSEMAPVKTKNIDKGDH
jgi:hypothetical protein